LQVKIVLDLNFILTFVYFGEVVKNSDSHACQGFAIICYKVARTHIVLTLVGVILKLLLC